MSLIETNRWEWSKLVARAKRRDGYSCVRCGSLEKLEVDHIVPRRPPWNGTDDLDNLRTLCRTCHLNRDMDTAPVKRNPLTARGSFARPKVW